MNYEDLFLGKKIVACDTETTGLQFQGTINPMYGYYSARSFAFSFTTYEGKNWYAVFEVDPYTRRVMYEKNLEDYFKLVKFFNDESIHKIFHNANFDLSVIKRINIDVKGKITDTMILSFVDNNQLPTALKPLCEQLFQINDDDQKDLITSVNKARRKAKKLGWCVATKENGFGDKPNKADYWLGNKVLCKQYAIMDTDRTMGLYYCFEERYENDSIYKELVDVEHEVIHIARDMQDCGIRMDENKIEELLTYYGDVINEQIIVKKELGYESLNPRSPKQMRETFYEKLGCTPVTKRRKDKNGDTKQTLTTDSETLNKWADTIPLAKCLIEISAAEHEVSTFIKPFKETSIDTSQGKILRPNYRTVGTVTGRISCAKPNLMNISSNDSIKRVSDTMYRARECFIPRDNHVLLFFDYSQIEVWITAFLSGDEVMIDYLMSGGDLHAKTGEACFSYKPDYDDNITGYRKKGKTINFGSIYGMGANLLMKSIDSTYAEADKALSLFWSTYIGLDAYRGELSDEIKEKGKIINPFGRELFMYSDIAYRGLNYMVQGSAAEVIKRALINVNAVIKNTPCKLVLNIHDELCIEVPTNYYNKFFMRSIITAMKADFHTYFGMPKPFGISVEYTKTNWAEKQKVNIK